MSDRHMCPAEVGLMRLVLALPDSPSATAVRALRAMLDGSKPTVGWAARAVRSE